MPPMRALQSGLLDQLPLPAVAAFRAGLREAIEYSAPDVVRLIGETGRLADASRGALDKALQQYVHGLTTGMAVGQEGSLK